MSTATAVVGRRDDGREHGELDDLTLPHRIRSLLHRPVSRSSTIRRANPRQRDRRRRQKARYSVNELQPGAADATHARRGGSRWSTGTAEGRPRSKGRRGHAVRRIGRALARGRLGRGDGALRASRCSAVWQPLIIRSIRKRVERREKKSCTEGRQWAPPVESPAAVADTSSMADPAWRPLGEILVERGLLDRVQLEHWLMQQRLSGMLLGELLVMHRDRLARSRSPRRSPSSAVPRTSRAAVTSAIRRQLKGRDPCRAKNC